jgi:hypothetical protein
MQLFKKLEECYDNMVHPQKRIDLKLVLEVTMARIVQLKHALVKYNPPSPDLPQEVPFPWEYVHVDDILVDLKLPPSTLEVPIPRFFLEDRAVEIKTRNKLVQGYMSMKLQLDK